MNQPLFSIVMPIYNVAPYLDHAITSILKQTYSDFELILVNDASTDSSLDICRQYEKEKRVKLIDLKMNKGVSHARNCGLEKALGTYILFLDPDDYVETDLLEKYREHIKDKEIDLLIVGANEEYFDKNKNIEYEKRIIPKDKFLNEKKDIYEEALFLESRTLFGYPWNKCYRTKVLKENNLSFKRVKMIEDIQFNLELLPHIRSMQILSIAPYHYAIRQNASLTHQKLNDYFQLHTARIQLFLEEYQTNMPSLLEQCKKAMAPIYCRYLLSAITRYEGKDKKKWLKSVFNSSLFQTLKPFMKFEGKKKWIFYPLVSQNIALSLMIGKTVGTVKEKLPMIFAKAKQTR